MLLYEAYYKKPGGWIWHKIKNVKGDSVMETASKINLPVRVIFLQDETRIEIPMTWAIKFSRGRFEMIKKDMEKAARQPLQMRN